MVIKLSPVSKILPDILFDAYNKPSMVYYYEYLHFIVVKIEGLDLRLQEPELKSGLHTTDFHQIVFKHYQVELTTGTKITEIKVANYGETNFVRQRSCVIHNNLNHDFSKHEHSSDVIFIKHIVLLCSTISHSTKMQA